MLHRVWYRWALFYSFLTFGLYCIYAATHKGNDLCDGDDLFNEVMPTWFAHIGPIELLVGVACSTYGISLRRIVVNGGVVHSAFAVCQLLLFLGRGTRSASLYAACHLVQYVSFGVGVYLGDALLNGQKYYFDQAAALNIRLLERRVEQLTVGKERAEYDRGMAQHSYQRLLTHLSSEEERKLSQTVHEIDRPSDNGSSCSCSGITDDPSTCEEDPTPVQALELLQPGVALDGSPSLSNPKGAAMSDSGWSDISRLLKVVDRKQNDDNALAVSSRLNPQAQEWSELSAQHAAQHMSQPGPLRTPGPLHVAVQPAQPATIVEHGCEQGGSQKAQAQKSATAIRREKRKRAAQRDLLRLEQQKAELGHLKPAVMTTNIPAVHPQYPFPHPQYPFPPYMYRP